MAKNHGHKGGLNRLYQRLLRDARRGDASDEGGQFHSPPYLSFDPAIEAERRAAQRGLLDTIFDTKRAAKRSKKDFKIDIRDLLTDAHRQRFDIKRETQRNLLGVRQHRQDVVLEKRRGMQDFGLQLQGLARKYTQLGNTQLQEANAAGVADSGTLAAAQAARASNRRFETKPIRIGQQRLRQDTHIALGRLGIQAQQIRQDRRIGLRRLRYDTRHDRRLIKLDYRRNLQDLHTRLERAIREQRIGDVDLIKQEIFNARANQPGTFGKYGRKRGGF